MLNLIKLDKELIVNGTAYKNASAAFEALKNHSGSVEILIGCKSAPADPPKTKTEFDYKNIYKISVRKYMTEKSVPEFDFMKKYNDDIPMPMRTMYGEILEETKGMLKMTLHGRAEKDCAACMHCGRKLTHPVSVYYGIGPICGEHMHLAPMSVLEKIEDKEKLFKEVDEALRKITWTGWIIKKAIEAQTLVESVKVKKEGVAS